MNFWVYQRISGKVENAVHHVEISTLVLEVIKFEKCVKYANERIDDVILSS